MIDEKRLIAKALGYGLDIGHCVEQLAQYARLLVEYNQKVNLTAITDPEGIENKHFIDSLLLASLPEVAGRVVDVGTGAGFPGIVAKLYKPQLALTLMEPTGKRVTFLRYVCDEMGLTDVEFVKERAEEAARKQWRELFDAATARAVADMAVLSEYCLPLVRQGGVFLAMKGAGATTEMEHAMGAVHQLGGECMPAREFILPDGSIRSILRCKKISQTPLVYPRNGGKIAKAPLK